MSAAWCACRRPNEEDAKRQHREREHLVQERVRIENQIEALLTTQGVRKRPSLRSWDGDLESLRTGDGRLIPMHLRAELDRLRRRLVATIEMIRWRPIGAAFQVGHVLSGSSPRA